MTSHSATRRKALPLSVLHTLLFSILPPLCTKSQMTRDMGASAANYHHTQKPQPSVIPTFLLFISHRSELYQQTVPTLYMMCTALEITCYMYYIYMIPL